MIYMIIEKKDKKGVKEILDKTSLEEALFKSYFINIVFIFS